MLKSIIDVRFYARPQKGAVQTSIAIVGLRAQNVDEYEEQIKYINDLESTVYVSDWFMSRWDQFDKWSQFDLNTQKLFFTNQADAITFKLIYNPEVKGHSDVYIKPIIADYRR